MPVDVARPTAATGVRPYDVVVMLTSAGGFKALAAVLSELAPDFNTPIVVLQHLSGSPSLLPELLGHRCALPVAWAVAGRALIAGEIVVSPPVQRLRISPAGRVHLAHAELHERLGDVLVESVADAYGQRALLVILTGMGQDGAVGARALHAAGGTVIAQADPEFPAMPRAAIATGAVDRIVPLREIAKTIMELVSASTA